MALTAPAPERQPVDWSDVGKAIKGWIIQELGVAPTNVYWANQNYPDPGYPKITMGLTAYTREGGRDEVRHVYVSTNPAGSQIEAQYYGPRALTVTLNAYVDESNGAHTPMDNAWALLSKLEGSTRRERALAKLGEGGLSLIEAGSITDLSEVVNEAYVSRAALDFRFRVPSLVSEETTWIDIVTVDGSTMGDASIDGDWDSTP